MVKKPTAEPRRTPIQRANDSTTSGWKARIKSEMEAQDLTMRALSSRADLGATTVRYILRDAEDISLDTLRKLANALNVPIVYLAVGARGVIEGEQHNLKVLPVWTLEEIGMGLKKPEVDHGVVAVSARDHPEDIVATLVQTSAMTPEGLNSPPPPGSIVLKGDIVIWSKSVQPEPGSLVIAKGVGSLGVALRRMGPIQDGKVSLLSLSHLYPRLSCRPSDIIGTVIEVHRKVRG